MNKSLLFCEISAKEQEWYITLTDHLLEAVWRSGLEHWIENLEVPGSSTPPHHYLDLFSVAPSSTPQLHYGQHPASWDSIIYVLFAVLPLLFTVSQLAEQCKCIWHLNKVFYFLLLFRVLQRASSLDPGHYSWQESCPNSLKNKVLN